ncbi:MAG: hypothetical protein AAGD01_16200 [Acidobacteriota bacterium]
MRWIVTGARIIVGLIFFVFGLNGFLNFLEVPPPVEFMQILVASGYLIPVKLCEVIGGALLLANRYVALGLVFIGPVIVNIVLFHALLDPRYAGLSYVTFALTVFLIWAYRGHFAGIFQAESKPSIG